MQSANSFLHFAFRILKFKGCGYMTAREAVDAAKKVTANIDEEILFRACERLERKLEKLFKREMCEFDREAELLAAGEVMQGYDDMYTVYLKREAALCVEDWDCYASYDAIFTAKWSELLEEHVREADYEKKSFGPDWRWS